MRLNPTVSTHEYIHPSEADLPDGEKTVWVFRTLTRVAMCRYYDKSVLGGGNPEGRFSSNDAYDLLADHLSAVRNAESEDGSRTDFDLDEMDERERAALIDRVPMPVALGLATEIVNKSQMAKADVGKS